MNVIYSIIAYCVASVLCTLFLGASDAGLHGGMFAAGIGGVFRILYWLFLIVAVLGFIWFFVSLTNFVSLQRDAADVKTIKNIRNAYLVSVLGALLTVIPAVGGFLNIACSIIALVMLIMGYNAYSQSAVLPSLAKSGALMLRNAVIISLVGSVIDLIPAVGGVLMFVCSVVAIIMLFMGWNRIANNPPA